MSSTQLLYLSLARQPMSYVVATLRWLVVAYDGGVISTGKTGPFPNVS